MAQFLGLDYARGQRHNYEHQATPGNLSRNYPELSWQNLRNPFGEPNSSKHYERRQQADQPVITVGGWPMNRR
jgi:hypothetical protein